MLRYNEKEMQVMKTQRFKGLNKSPRWIRFLVLVITLAFLFGCATTHETVKPEKVEEKGPGVSRLSDGREGFVITEVPTMDGESRKDFERAVNMINDQKYEKAIELLSKVIDSSPGATAPYINMAIAYMRIDKLEKAEQHLKTALYLFPNHPVASNEYGLLLRKSGRFAEAREIFEKTLTAFPEYLPAHRNLGILCDLYLNDQVCARQQYEIYSEAMPEDKQVKMWIADLNLRQGR